MQLTAQFIATTLADQLVNKAASSRLGINFSEVVTDSRKIKAGCLFVGIPGDQFDGNKFAESALAAGAAGVLTSTAIDGDKWSTQSIFQVKDSLMAFRVLAKSWRAAHPMPIIAVGGSVGKTTTKELIASILSGKFSSVLRTSGSENGFAGIPITLMKLNSTHGAGVIEIGIDDIGAMTQHWDLVQPDLSLLTVTGPEHLEKLIDVATAAREECLLLEKTAASGKKTVLNLNDPNIVEFANTKLPATDPHRYGFVMGAPVTTSLKIEAKKLFRGRFDERAQQLRIERSDGEMSFDLQSPLAGSHNAHNLLAATTCALAMGLNVTEIERGLVNFKTPAGRSEVKSLDSGQVVVCDYYNANPSSVEAAIKMTESIHQSRSTRGGKIWLCLGDMLELGTHEEQMHRALSRSILTSSADQIVLVGQRMRWLAEELSKSNKAASVRHFDDHAPAAFAMKSESSALDTILIKGSRGLRMEKVWTEMGGI